LSVRGCWFGGFKQCLEVAAFAGTEVFLDQCMMIRSQGSDPWDSWAIRVRHEPANAVRNFRKLILRRCTVREACLLRAEDFNPAAPLVVRIEGTAVQAGALLAWKSEAKPSRACLGWSGQDNLYDLPRTARAICLNVPLAIPDGLAAPDDWDKLMDEPGSQDRQICFSDPDSVNRASPRPEEFPVQELHGVPVGADPGQVGPESGPAAPVGTTRGP